MFSDQTATIQVMAMWGRARVAIGWSETTRQFRDKFSEAGCHVRLTEIINLRRREGDHYPDEGEPFTRTKVRRTVRHFYCLLPTDRRVHIILFFPTHILMGLSVAYCFEQVFCASRPLVRRCPFCLLFYSVSDIYCYRHEP